ncbi:hypothetical protein LSM04_005794 [Trypanosoma melophagium]|uniref:uncharacterized protein n=1 Tax=Trypanosoma melophagium TaxID=715481 RepID=UPI00351A2747|nr:hypothetical protein LSM04_005794 [Trypanosoma melophagium]
MDAKAGKRRTTLMAPQSPKLKGANRSNSNKNNNNNNNTNNSSVSSPQAESVLQGIVTPTVSSTGNNNNNNNNSNDNNNPVKGRPFPVTRTDSLLKPPPPLRRTTTMPSGMHIRRLPPSVQGRAASPLLARHAVASLRKEIIEHRTDPSPAPSRPPRTIKRHSLAASPPMFSLNPAPPPRGVSEQQQQQQQRMTSAFQGGANDRKRSSLMRRSSQESKKNYIVIENSSAPQRSASTGVLGVARRNIVLDAKQNIRPMSGRKQPLDVLAPPDKDARAEAVRCYKKLCEEVGQAPQETWILAVLSGEAAAAASSSAETVGNRDDNTVDDKKVLTPSGEGIVISSAVESKLRIVNNKITDVLGAGTSSGIGNNNSGVGLTMEKGQKRRKSNRNLPQGVRPAKEVKRSNSVPKRLGSSLSFKTSTPSSGNALVKSHKGSDALLEQMVAYCQHLQPYRRKMEVLSQQRKSVHETLSRFLALCEDSQQQITQSSSKLHTISILGSQAATLTDGLRELQRCNVALLLLLAECSREVRRPLGTVSNVLPSTSADRQQQQPQIESKKSEDSASPLPSFIQRTPSTPHLLAPLTQSGASSPAPLPLPFFIPSSNEPPVGYLNFLRAEERLIVQELTEVCERVREALSKWSSFAIADKSILETPLFIPSASNVRSAYFDERLQRQQSGGAGCLYFHRSGAAGSGPSSIALSHSENTGNNRGYTTRSSCSTKSTENRIGNIMRSTAGTEGSSCTPASDQLYIEGQESQLPFVGVAQMGWSGTTPTTTAVSSITPVAENDSNSQRSHTNIPQLVLGGGKQCFSPCTTLEKCSSATALSKAEGKSVSIGGKGAGMGGISTKKTFAKMKTAGTTATRGSSSSSSPRIVKGSKTKALLKVGRSASTTDVVAIAHIREAEQTWETIKGLAALIPSREELWTEEMKSQNNNNNNVTNENKVSNARRQLKLISPTSPPDISLEKDIKSLSAQRRVLSIESLSDAEVSSSIPSALTLYRENQQKKEATRVIVRYLRKYMNSKSKYLKNKEKMKGGDYQQEKVEMKPPVKVETGRKLDSLEVQVKMAKRIARCWHQYNSRKTAEQRRLQLEEEGEKEKRWHYENVMAYRLQRFFARILTQRKLRDAIKKKAILNEKANGGKDTSTVSDGKNTKEGNERVMTARERFERARERRKNLMRSRLEGGAGTNTNTFTVNSTTTTTTTVDDEKESIVSVPISSLLGIKLKRNQSEEEEEENGKGKETQRKAMKDATIVPPLSLKTTRISTFSIDNYHPERESFEVGVLHRLLRAPKSILYAMRIMCDACPTRPDSALETLSTAERGSLKLKCGSVEKLKEQELKECEGKDEDDGNNNITNNNKDSKGKENGQDEKGNSSIHKTTTTTTTTIKDGPKQGRSDGSKVHHDKLHLELASYRTVCYRLGTRACGTKHGNKPFSVCPSSVRFQSIIEEDELRQKDLKKKRVDRPFERWGAAYAFQRRVFAAAAVYAWKLIFSHTPHDDYKQSMLKTKEEQEARLERVEQRNRMILACYCVRSEREWLKEASRDLSFVGHIWNPKKSLDPNDPDFERHCRETYEFVEDFLYQCFPTITSLDDVPTFLIGAGVYFVLKPLLSWMEEDMTLAKTTSSPLSRVVSPHTSSTPLSPQQRHVIFTCELLNLLDDIACWSGPVSGEREAVSPGTCSVKECDSSGTWEDAFERTTRSLAMTMPLGGISNTPSLEVSGVNESPVTATDPVKRPRLQLVRVPVPTTTLLPSMPNSSTSEEEKMPREADAVLSPPPSPGTPPPVLQTASRHHGGFNGSSVDGKQTRLILLPPKGYLVSLSERLVYALLGIALDLEVCEDLDAMA